MPIEPDRLNTPPVSTVRDAADALNAFCTPPHQPERREESDMEAAQFPPETCPTCQGSGRVTVSQSAQGTGCYLPANAAGRLAELHATLKTLDDMRALVQSLAGGPIHVNAAHYFQAYEQIRAVTEEAIGEETRRAGGGHEEV